MTTLPSKNPSKNLVFTENPLEAPSKKHLLLKNLLRTLLRSVRLYDPLGVHPIVCFPIADRRPETYFLAGGLDCVCEPCTPPPPPHISFLNSMGNDHPRGPKDWKIQDFAPGLKLSSDQSQIENFNRDWKFQASHTARPLFVGNYQGRDWSFQARLNISIEIENFNPGLKISSVWIENVTRSIGIDFFNRWALRDCFVTWLSATDPLPPHTARHIEQPPLRVADSESILAVFFSPKIGRKRSKMTKNDRKSARIWVLGRAWSGGQSGWPGGLCGWVINLHRVNGRGHFGGQTAGGHPQAFPWPKKPHGSAGIERARKRLQV